MSIFDKFRRTEQSRRVDDDALEGAIVEFDAADSLGWIELDDGRRIRFGLRACQDFKAEPGCRVRVSGLHEVRGSLRPTLVELALNQWDLEELVWPKVLEEFSIVQHWENGEQMNLRLKRKLFDREAFIAAQTPWPSAAEFADFGLIPADSSLWNSVEPPPPHPFFEPWAKSIVATGLGATHLVDDIEGDVSACVGGSDARLARPWPACPHGHGPMTLLVGVEPAAFKGLFREPRRLTIHACVSCLNNEHSVQLGSRTAVASVEWQLDSVCSNKSADVATQISTFELRSKPMLSFPPSWLSQPADHIEGFIPVQGIPTSLFEVKLLRDGGTDGSKDYDAADYIFDSHYNKDMIGIALGGYPSVHFELCNACKHPRYQLLSLSDYFTDQEFTDLFEGSNELTLLSCNRTPQCGGPEYGMLLLHPY